MNTCFDFCHGVLIALVFDTLFLVGMDQLPADWSLRWLLYAIALTVFTVSASYAKLPPLPSKVRRACQCRWQCLVSSLVSVSDSVLVCVHATPCLFPLPPLLPVHGRVHRHS